MRITKEVVVHTFSNCSFLNKVDYFMGFLGPKSCIIYGRVNHSGDFFKKVHKKWMNK